MESGSERQDNSDGGASRRSLRLFLAFRLSEHALDECAKLQQRIGERVRSLRRIPVQNLHLTVKFLGSLPEDAVPDVRAAVSALAHRPVFRIALDSIGVFPERGPAKVVFSGCSRPSPRFAALARDSERRFASLGVSPETRDTVPHVTLFRAGDGGSRENVREILRSIPPAVITEELASLVLVRSITDPEGARYEPVFEAPLLTAR